MANSQHTTRLQKAYYCSTTLAIYQIVSVVSAFILPRMILSAYGSSYNGLISSITYYLGTFSIIQAGISGASRVALYKTLANHDNEGTSSIMVANRQYYRKISGILIGYILLLAIIFPVMMKNDFYWLDVVSLVVIIGISSFVQYCYGLAYLTLLNADGASYVVNITQSIALIANTLVTVLVIKSGGSVQLAKLFGILFFVASQIFLYVYTNQKYKLDKKAPPNDIALKGRWDVLANSIANAVHANIDILFITIFCASNEVSVYSIYYLVYNGLVRIIQILTDGLEAAFGNMYSKDDRQALKRNFNFYEFFLFAVTAILTSCMATLLIPFINLYTSGVKDVDYTRPLFANILTITLMTYCIRSPYVTMVQAAGKYKETKVGSFVEAGLNIVLTLVLVNIWGITGAVIGTAIANLYRSIQYGLFVSKNIMEQPWTKLAVRISWLAITTICSISLIIVIPILGFPNKWVEWLIKACLNLVISCIVVGFSSLIFYRRDLNNTVQIVYKLLKQRIQN